MTSNETEGAAAVTPYYARQAIYEDWPVLEGLRVAAAKRLRDAGVSQWQNTAVGLTQMAGHLGRGEMYLVREIDMEAAKPGQVAGCFALTTWGDPRCWVGDPEHDHFMYLQKVVTNPRFAHCGVGAFAVSYAVAQARQQQRLGVRLDCVAGNDALHRRWEKLGFSYLRTVDGRGGSVLMEMRIEEPS